MRPLDSQRSHPDTFVTNEIPMNPSRLASLSAPHGAVPSSTDRVLTTVRVRRRGVDRAPIRLGSLLALLSSLALSACANDGPLGEDAATDRQATENPDQLDVSKVVETREGTNDGSGAVELDLATRVQQAEPSRTRAGWLHFRDPALMVPEALPLFAARLSDTSAPSEVRVALAEVLGHTTADPTTYVVAAYAGEADAAVRAALVETLRLSKGDNAAPALALLETALSDADPSVRLSAMLCVTRRPDGASIGAAIVPLVSDADVKVRAAAARAAGVLKVEGAQQALVGALADADPTVRLNALRAIDRIDSTYLASHGLLDSLKADSDSKVSRLASTIASR